ncbi:MAG: hypothetical protein IKK34_02505 [Clostridia bacterium]|nr:hypothetical protein [Clostridia bacterium]
MKKRCNRAAAYDAEIVFQPALTPMEAAVLPARERPTAYRGALRLAREAQCWERVLGGEACDQRQKICVRYT